MRAFTFIVLTIIFFIAAFGLLQTAYLFRSPRPTIAYGTPPSAAVKAVVAQYQGGTFDGTKGGPSTPDQSLPAAVVVGVIVYFLPTLIAMFRGHLAPLAIFFADLVFGWTIIGWIVCLIWAANSNTRANRV